MDSQISESLIPAVNTIPIGLPVLFVVGGWMYGVGAKVGGWDEVDMVQGIAEEIG